MSRFICQPKCLTMTIGRLTASVNIQFQESGCICMKFSEYKYERPDVKALEAKFKELLGAFESAGSYEEQDAAMTGLLVVLLVLILRGAESPAG